MPRLKAGQRLILATHNPDKLRVLRQAAADFGLRPTDAADLGLSAPREASATFSSAAREKALEVARATGLAAMADDSGFCVAALDGAPGVNSSNWAGATGDYARALTTLGHRLGGQMPSDPLACFVSSIAVAWPDGTTACEEGCSWGAVTWPPRGSGPDYDPVFAPAGSHLTAAELGVVNGQPRPSYSHRSEIVRNLLGRLTELSGAG